MVVQCQHHFTSTSLAFSSLSAQVVFRQTDRNHSGTIEKEESFEALQKLGFDIPTAARAALFNRFAKKRQYMDFDDFVACCCRAELMHSECLELRHTHTCMHTYTHTYAHTYTRTHTHTCTYTHMHMIKPVPQQYVCLCKECQTLKHAHNSVALIFLPPALYDTNIHPLSVDVFKKYGSGASLTLSKDDVGDMVHVCMCV